MLRIKEIYEKSFKQAKKMGTGLISQKYCCQKDKRNIAVRKTIQIGNGAEMAVSHSSRHLKNFPSTAFTLYICSRNGKKQQ